MTHVLNGLGGTLTTGGSIATISYLHQDMTTNARVATAPPGTSIPRGLGAP
jgi:hypothetical protein